MKNEEAKEIAISISKYGHGIPKPVTEEWVKESCAKGMIPKSDLVDGAYYIGCCRNAYLAVWIAEEEKFYYLRRKFSHIFSESINHPEDDNSFDLFIPIMRLFDE